MSLRPATQARKNDPGKKLLVTRGGSTEVLATAALTDLLHASDVLVYNNSAVLPASLAGTHVESGTEIELRLAALLEVEGEWNRWRAVIWKKASWKVRTEARQTANFVRPGDGLVFGALAARVLAVHRSGLFEVEFHAPDAPVLRGILTAGLPVQYSHLAADLKLWDIQTVFCGPALSVEPPSAAFILNWERITALRQKGVQLIAIAHGAGLSSLGSPQQDQALPLAEWSFISAAAAAALNRAKARGRRIIALGTTVARCLESAHRRRAGVVAPGWFRTEVKLGAQAPAAFADGLVTGLHEEGESHFELEQAFLPRSLALQAQEVASRYNLHKHEFGDFHFLLKPWSPDSASTDGASDAAPECRATCGV